MGQESVARGLGPKPCGSSRRPVALNAGRAPRRRARDLGSTRIQGSAAACGTGGSPHSILVGLMGVFHGAGAGRPDAPPSEAPRYDSGPPRLLRRVEGEAARSRGQGHGSGRRGLPRARSRADPERTEDEDDDDCDGRAHLCRTTIHTESPTRPLREPSSPASADLPDRRVPWSDNEAAQPLLSPS